MAKKAARTKIQVRELEIEDVFVYHPPTLARLLGWEHELSLVARQLPLPSGRLDLLFVSRNELFLIELKVEPFKDISLKQILQYRDDLLQMQEAGALVSGPIRAFLLVTGFTEKEHQLAAKEGVATVAYEPGEVLEAFYQQAGGLSNFLKVRPVDLGVWNIHVINRVLYSLPQHSTREALSKQIDIALSTTRNHLNFARQLGLVALLDGNYLLTDLGREYISARDHSVSEFVLSEGQTEALKKHIATDPFSSSVVFGIFSLVEAVFTLSRNCYPVEMEQLINFYKESVGKKFDWATERSAFLGTHAFCNFAAELGLVARAGSRLFLTPSGFRFILMLQLHKGIKIVDSLGLGTT